jgi:hypothetical protein
MFRQSSPQHETVTELRARTKLIAGAAVVAGTTAAAGHAWVPELDS